MSEYLNTGVPLQVVPSALNASFAGDGQLIDIPKFNILTLDVSGSHDPDVPQGNKTGMWAEVLCYANSRAAEFREREAQQIVSAREWVCGMECVCVCVCVWLCVCVG